MSDISANVWVFDSYTDSASHFNTKQEHFSGSMFKV